MNVYQGKSVFGGIAIGHLCVYKKGEQQVTRQKIEDVEAEVKRFQDAKEAAQAQLGELYDKAVKEVGEANAAIFEMHQMLLEDEDYQDSVENIIRTQQVNAEYATAVTSDHFSSMFAEMDDDYMKERAADIRDISERVIANLSGENKSKVVTDEPVIILADDLAPSETVQLEKDKVLSFVTVHGSVNSHTAILARTMGIPALVSTEMELTDDLDGKLAVVDGNHGMIYVEPDAETMEKMEALKKEEEEKKELLQTFKNKESVTLDGKKVLTYANIGNVKDLALVLQNGAEGIGLFRSEFLYLEADNYPNEEAQFQAYKTVAENMAGKKVIVRTLDIGADKQVDYFNLDHEENPAMGYRAIRICLDRRDIFRTQLRALLRASAYGNIGIMYPMIISVDEVKEIKKIVESIKTELTEKGIEYGEVEQGIMIETPAAVMISDLLAEEVDFFSIGTNDLTQYTLAIDRQNSKLDNIYDAHHPAVLRMIQKTIENGHKAGCWVGICGELGADMTLTETFLKMGIDELSVSPTFVLPIRKLIREMSTK